MNSLPSVFYMETSALIVLSHNDRGVRTLIMEQNPLLSTLTVLKIQIEENMKQSNLKKANPLREGPK